MQEISEMVFCPLNLGAGCCQRFFWLCRGLRTLAHCTSPVKKNVHDRPWTDITVLESPEMAFTNFLEKTTKASDRKLPDGRELLELLPFIVLFVMHRLRRVY